MAEVAADVLRPAPGSTTGSWTVGGGTPEQGGLTCPLFLWLEDPTASDEMRFRFTRSPTKLQLSSQSGGARLHYARSLSAEEP